MTHTGKNICLWILALLLSCTANAQRIEQNLDFDWRFHLGDIAAGEAPTTDHSTWRQLDVPHDWSIEGEYDQNNPGKGWNAFLPGGIGWYRREIPWNDTWEGRNVAVNFDGIYMNSTVWINGHKLGYRPNGYLDVHYDLTPYLRPGMNILAVRVDNSLQPSARWYNGSGIYRHVRLIVTDPVRVAHNGTYVTTPDVTSEQATVAVEAEIVNPTGNRLPVTIESVVADSRGREVARSNRTLTLTDRGTTLAVDRLTVANPALWSPESPAVYYLTTRIVRDGKAIDDYVTRFGIRKAEFDPDRGFILNGVPTKFKGVCIHQNTGAVGSAMPDDLLYKRLVQLKEMGCNAIRTSHYAYAPEFYAMCDTMGFMVMNELFDGWFQWKGANKARYDYGYYFLDWWERDLADFIRRDRNHPSVMIWSMGNEVWGYERHQYLQWKINDTFHRLDPTRPTTQAWALDTYLDIAGFNANGESRGDLAAFRQKQPGKLAIGTEIPHTRSTRGVYRTLGSYNAWRNPERFSDKERERLFPIDSLTDTEVFTEFDPGYASSYDNQTRKISVREQWKQTRDNPFMIGEFRWTAFDYLGEAWGWPSRTNNYGIIDLAGFPKDNYYLYQSLWSDQPMVHLLPHWTWPGKEGVEIPVVVYTNGDEAELLIDGRSLGRRTMDPDTLQLVWRVPYQPGTLTAVAYKDGREIARKSCTTAEKPAAVRLTPDRTTLTANRSDVVCITADIVDSRGRLVPYASNAIRFEVSGPYKLLGVENGDILDMNPQKVLGRKAFMGKALLILQTTGESGVLQIKALSDGLRTGKTSVHVKPTKTTSI
ncbi:MAG: glycoside hydrolase family 2 protein [Rikenellaceae bacterium]|nr:glycoside hydrolase family 2 protein [Rikenellaceae bacterium]